MPFGSWQRTLPRDGRHSATVSPEPMRGAECLRIPSDPCSSNTPKAVRSGWTDATDLSSLISKIRHQFVQFILIEIRFGEVPRRELARMGEPGMLYHASEGVDEGP